MSEVEWQPGLLREIAQPVGDKWVPSSIDTNIPYVGLEHISPENPRIGAYGKSADVISTKNQFKAGDILFGKLRPYLKKVAHADLSGVCSTDIIPIRANQKADPSYLYYLLSSPKVIAKAVESSAGNVMPRASWSDLADIEIEIPPLPEQKKIAEILSGIDYLLKAKEAKVKKTRLLLKYTIEDATRKSATGEAVPLKEFGEWKGGGTPSKSVSEYWNGEIPWVSPKDMKEQRISTSQDKITEAAIENSATSLVTRGSILFVVRSGILRHTLPMALAARDVAINQDLKALTVNESCNVNFLFHYLSCKSDEILASCMKSGTTVESIDTNSLQNYEVPTLSPEIQAQLSLFAEGITKTCEGEESQIRSLKMLKSAISSDLLSGRKRVSV